MSLPPEPIVRSLISRHMGHEFREIIEGIDDLRFMLKDLNIFEFEDRLNELSRRAARIRTAFLRAFPVIQFP